MNTAITIAKYALEQNKPLFRLITAASTGTILEWYDFSLFAYLTPILAKLFFPNHNELVSLMETYAIFAIGYFVRPLGAIVFGHYGDRKGRQKILILSITMMSASTFLIGFLPTYENVGILAPILLIILRLFQGLSVGGESTGASLFVLESIPDKHRGFFGALLWSMTGIGMLVGSFAATWVTDHATLTWAWRIPFWGGLITGIVGYFLRKKTSESLMFISVVQRGLIKLSPLKEGFALYKKESLVIIGLYTLSAMITYLVFVFMPVYATKIIGTPSDSTSLLNSVAFLLVTLLVPFGGYLSDKWGRRNCLMISALGFLFLSYPLYCLIATANFFYLLIAQSVFLILAVGFQGAISAAVFEAVPTAVRFSVLAVCYNLSYSVFGGSAPFVATTLVSFTGHNTAPGLYLMAGALVAVIALCFYSSQKMESL